MEAEKVIKLTKQLNNEIEQKIKGIVIFTSKDSKAMNMFKHMFPNKDIVIGVETESNDVFAKI